MIEPSQLANAWYLRFGHGWVLADGMDKEWKQIAHELMKHDYLRYELSAWGESLSTPEGKKSVSGVTEIYRLKGE